MRYQRLFDLRIDHGFCTGARCSDVRIEPRAWHASGVRALARHRLVVRAQPGGLEIVGPVDGNDRPFINLADELRLGFDVRVTGPDFAHYTDFATWPAIEKPVFHGSDPAGGALGLGSGPSPPQGVAAGIEISGINGAWLSAPPRFVLEFQARKALWVFYLITPRQTAALPEIVDGEPLRALTFARRLLSPDNTSATADPVGYRLMASYPERRCFRMASDRLITGQRAPLRRLALHLGDEILLRELPNPSIHSHTTLKVEPSPEPCNSLFRVIEF